MDPFTEPDPGDPGDAVASSNTNNNPKQQQQQAGSKVGRVVSIARGHEPELLFDPEELKVDDLRIECKMRGIPSSGTKQTVIKKLLQAIRNNPDLPLTRLSSPAEKPKKAVNKREPQREDYETEEEFSQQWQLWRQQRDHNNESVKKSREAAKRRKEEHERQCRVREEENKNLATAVCQMKKEVMFLVKMLREPGNATGEERRRIDTLMKRISNLPQIPTPTSQESASLAALGPLAETETGERAAKIAKRS